MGVKSGKKIIGLTDGGDDKVAASLAGHSFHWYIAIQQALSLFNPENDLRAIGLEGGPEPVPGCEIADLIQYYADADADADDVSTEAWTQIKYSRAARNEPFTFSFLTKTLVKFFLVDRNDQKEARPRKRFIFFTNRPADDSLSKDLGLAGDALKACESFSKFRAKLLENDIDASDAEIADFLARFEIQDRQNQFEAAIRGGERLVRAYLPGEDSRAKMAVLFENIVSCAQSEDPAKRRINRETVLDWLGFDDPADLFPAPPKFVPVKNPLRRVEADRVSAHLETHPEDPLLVTAPAGVGKTVFMQQLRDELSISNEVVLFDCFAAGEYRWRDDARHRPEVGLSHIVSELFARGYCAPILETRRSREFYRVVRARLSQASEAIRKERSDARLILLIDAADNAAQQGRDEREDDFASWLYQTLSQKPIPGVSLLMSCRGYRVNLVTPAPSPQRVDLTPFDRDQTDVFLDRRAPDLSADDRDILFAQSRGVARVLDYLLQTEFAKFAPSDTLTVEEILDQRVDMAIDALVQGGATDVEKAALLTALVRLSPPVSMDALGIATGLDPARLRSFATALMPLVIQTNEGLTFRDEDAQVWSRTQADLHPEQLDPLCERLQLGQSMSVPAATALPLLLFELNRTDDLLALALSDTFPSALTGRIAQQRLRAMRLQTALHSASLDDNPTACLQLLLELAVVWTTEGRADDFVAKFPALASQSEQTQALERLRTATPNSEHRPYLPGRRLLAALGAGLLERASIEARRYDESLMANEGRLVDSDVEPIAALICLAQLRGRPGQAVQEAARLRSPHFQYDVAQALYRLQNTMGCKPEDLADTLVAGVDNVDVAKVRGLALSLVHLPGLSTRVSGRLLGIASRGWEPDGFKLPSTNYARDESQDSLVLPALRAAAIAARMGRKADARRLMKACADVRPSVNEFTSDYATGKIIAFATQQVLKAFLSGRELRPKDCLPPQIARKAVFRNVSDIDKCLKALETLRKDHIKNKGSSRRRRRALTYVDDRDVIALSWTIRELFEVGSCWLGQWRSQAAVPVIRLGAWIADRMRTEVSDYRLHNKKTALTHLRVGLGLQILTTLDELETPAPEDVEAVTAALESAVTTSVMTRWAAYLASRDSLVGAALKAASLTRDRLQSEADVDMRVQGLSSLARALSGRDKPSIRALVDDVLVALDGVGGGDHKILNGVLSLACVQSGGRVSFDLARRFLDLCELNIYEASKFPWMDLGASARSFSPAELVARLARWDGRDIASLDDSLWLALGPMVTHGFIGPEHAYALCGVASPAYGLYRRPSDAGHMIAEAANDAVSIDTGPAIHRQLFIQDGADEAQRFADLCGTSFMCSPDWGGFGFWEDHVPGFVERDTPTEQLGLAMDASETPDLVRAEGESMAACVARLIALPKIEASIHRSDTLILWGRDHVTQPQDRRDYLAAVVRQDDLSFWAACRAACQLCTDWSIALPDMKSLRLDLADTLLERFVGDNQTGVRSLLRDLGTLSGLDRSAMARKCLSVLSRQRLRFGTEDAFELAEALLVIAPDRAFEAFSNVLSSPTFDLPEAHRETDQQTLTAALPTEPPPDVFVAAFLWGQLGHTDTMRRLAAGLAVGRLAESKLISCLEILIKARHADPALGMWPFSTKFSRRTARSFLLLALERAAHLYPEHMVDLCSTMVKMSQDSDLTAAETRAIANALESIYAQETGRTPHYNQTVLSKYSPIPAPPPSWSPRPEGDGPEFTFDYDFSKSEPFWTASLFGGEAWFEPSPKRQLINAVHRLDPDLTHMYDDGSGLRRRAYSRWSSGLRVHHYGEQVVLAALEALGSRWLEDHPLVERDDPDPLESAEDWLAAYRPTSGYGLWTSDASDLPPSFVELPVATVGDDPTFADVEPLLSALGLRGDRDGLVLAGRWRPVGGGGVRLFPALVTTHGSITACKRFRRRPWHDCYLPNLYQVRMYDESGVSREGFRAFAEEIEAELKIDRWDPLGSPQAFQPFSLGLSSLNSLGLEGFGNGLYHPPDSEDVKLAHSAWGLDPRNYRDDEDRSGKALVADRAWIDRWLVSEKLSLVFTLRRSYSKSKSWERGSGERQEDNLLLRYTPGQRLRIWKLAAYKPNQPYQ